MLINNRHLIYDELLVTAHVNGVVVRVGCPVQRLSALNVNLFLVLSMYGSVIEKFC